MNSIVSMAYGMYHVAKAQEEQFCKEFKERAEQNVKDYWDACKYPRKKKKAIRKKAEADYIFHMRLAQPTLFSF